MLLLSISLMVLPTVYGTAIFPKVVEDNVATPTQPSPVERDSHNHHTVSDWWHDSEENKEAQCTLQISEYQYDDQAVATKTGFKNISDQDVAAAWLSRLLELTITEINASDMLTGERSLLELSFRDAADHEMIFIALQTCADNADSVYINGSFMPSAENIPGNIFRIEDADARPLFNELWSLIKD